MPRSWIFSDSESEGEAAPVVPTEIDNTLSDENLVVLKENNIIKRTI